MNPANKSSRIATILCLIGLISTIGMFLMMSTIGLSSFSGSTSTRTIWTMLAMLRPFTFPAFFFGIYFELTLTLLMYILFLIGCIRFSRNQENYGLAGFFLSIVFFENICAILFRIMYLFVFLKAGTSQTLDYVQLLISFGTSITFVILAKVALDGINSSTNLITLSYGQGSQLVLTFDEAASSARFVHRLVDMLVNFLVLIKFISGYFILKRFMAQSSSSSYYDRSDDLLPEQLQIYLTIVASTFIYYVLYESIFSRTPAKYLTRTRVTLNDGSRPPFGTILKRTLIRFVPFEPFSFLGSGKWHDSWSNTYVLRESNPLEATFDFERNGEEPASSLPDR